MAATRNRGKNLKKKDGRKRKTGSARPVSRTVVRYSSRVPRAVARPVAPVQRQSIPRSVPYDPVVRRFLSCVTNPWDGPLVKSIGVAGPCPTSAVVRRRNICTVTLEPLDSGVDVFIPHGCTYDPFVATATVTYNPSGTVANLPGPTGTDIANAQAWSAVAAAGTAPNFTTQGTGVTVSFFNRDPTVTIPVGSTCRVVSSGVRITCLESSQIANGVFYHHFTPATIGAGGAANSAPSNGYGSNRAAATEAMGIYKVSAGRPIALVNPSWSGWDTVADIASTFTAGVKTSALTWPAGTGGVRLYFDGTGAQRFLFEICTVVEYYHDSHKAFAQPVITHPDGDGIITAVNSVLMRPASNNADIGKHGGSNSLAAKLESATNALRHGVEFVGTAMRGAYGAVKGYQMIKGAISAGEGIAEMAALALV